MVRRAFEAISEIPTKLISFSDDMDGMRKVPDNVPNREMLAEHLHKPLTSVPDPFGQYESFGHHNNAMLRRFLDTFGFDYEFYSAKGLLRERPVRRHASPGRRALRGADGGHAGEPSRRAPADLFDLPADPPRDGPGALRADPACRREGGHRDLSTTRPDGNGRCR